ncbi:MAG: cytochrome b/b6 domain-containing protein [Zoogloeaceae bacterium]|jgi:cytochrome b|nr:cytochrome b/b6 domain-containing protein [Zoogloeaceae bacterium]
MQKIRIWDVPTRLFHWLLVLSIALLFVTGIEGGNWMEWHGKLGLLVVGLLAFRLVWGLTGSTYARFLQFFPTPSSVQAYLQGKWEGYGHNPLGAFSVFTLLFLVLAQTLSGLVSNDEISFYGPLYKLAGSDLSLWWTGMHKALAYYCLAVFIGLHVASIVFYKLVKKDNLVIPMLTGTKEAPPKDADKGLKGGGFLPLVVALLFAALAVWGASGQWIPAPPPPPPVETPSW